MDKNVHARFHAESMLYDDLVDQIEIDTENKRYWIFLNQKADIINSPDRNGEYTKSMSMDRSVFDIIHNSVKELFWRLEPNSDGK